LGGKKIFHEVQQHMKELNIENSKVQGWRCGSSGRACLVRARPQVQTPVWPKRKENVEQNRLVRARP
jgi:hypothetical protein